MAMNYQQQQRFQKRVVAIAERLGRAAGDRAVDDETCGNVGLMGSYEEENFGLSDFESDFAARLYNALERIEFGSYTDEQRFRREVMDAAWGTWVGARNARVRALCPRAQVYGSE
jgi:hypothetical protein